MTLLSIRRKTTCSLTEWFSTQRFTFISSQCNIICPLTHVVYLILYLILFYLYLHYFSTQLTWSVCRILSVQTINRHEILPLDGRVSPQIEDKHYGAVNIYKYIQYNIWLQSPITHKKKLQLNSHMPQILYALVTK